LLYTTLLKFSCTKNSIQHSIIVGPTTKMDTTNKRSYMVMQMGSRKSEQTKNNFIESNRIESNRIVFFSAESPNTSFDCVIM